MGSPAFTIHRLTADDLTTMDALLTTFGEAFEDVDTYRRKRPGAAYLEWLLDSDTFIALAALKGDDGHAGPRRPYAA